MNKGKKIPFMLSTIRSFSKKKTTQANSNN